MGALNDDGTVRRTDATPPTGAECAACWDLGLILCDDEGENCQQVPCPECAFAADIDETKEGGA